MNNDTVRNRAIRASRGFFAARGLLEVRTAKCVVSGAMEPYIDTFSVTGQLSGHRGYLASSPEFAMKKIFAAELAHEPHAAGIYEIAPVFRDDIASTLHLPEFTMIEWYVRNCDRQSILHMARELISHVAAAVGKTIAPPPMCTVDLRDILAENGLSAGREEILPYSRLYTSKFGAMPPHVNNLDGEIACFNLLFDESVLPVIRRLPGIVAVEGFPVSLSALARTQGQTAARTELFVAGIELANAYSEEWNSEAVRQRWESYNEIRRLRGVPEHPVDAELLGSLPAMKDVCGIALGLERTLLALPQLTC